MRKIDLHLHSYNSDGTRSPKEIVKKAEELGISCISLTDHDTVSGIEECMEACIDLDLTFIPGVELSTLHKGKSIHILGYFNKETYKSPELISFLSSLKNKRIERCYKVADKLKENFNIIVDLEKLIGDGNKIIARPHIARAIIDAGYDYDFNYIFDNIIGNNCPAYVPSNRISTAEGIQILNKLNAKIFLAHPVLIKSIPLEELLSLGFHGLECYYPLNKKEDTDYFLSLAKEHNLYVSCGSDDHGIMGDSKHGTIGSMEIDDYNYTKLMEFLLH